MLITRLGTDSQCLDPWNVRRTFASGRGELDPHQEVNMFLAMNSFVLAVVSGFEHQAWKALAPILLLTLVAVWSTPPWCATCSRLTRLDVSHTAGAGPEWTASFRRCGIEIRRRFQGPPLTLHDLSVLLAALGLTAALAELVHPLFWSTAFVAIAWFMGRDASKNSGTRTGT